MADVVVTVPKSLWHAWLFEGDLPRDIFDDRVGCPDCGWTGPREQWNGHYEPAAWDFGPPSSGLPARCPVGLRPLAWDFTLATVAPEIEPGERVYVAAYGLIRGYAPLVDLRINGRGCSLIRGADARAVTPMCPGVGCFEQWHRNFVPPRCTPAEPHRLGVRGFQGFRYRWWDTADEVPFPDFATLNVS